ncbi:DUF3800 domain-containing protein [Corynebacterium sp. c9Ua_112]|uniref:DUF3800 domain-containing protein n=2 Tax=Corynebacterium macclintockiae TaxID=2913501 RepID=A0A9X3RQQ1_9CORY|nr:MULTISPECIES: DUF3800 domain-containing protein [Corynebacterium]MCZ9305570.1 DUF3800 domain-containing protein [Corynebacterium macclintockiae]MDK8870250.1 DUF3800 domain-containing protein [Corynebacterium macclintockiae]OFM59859.1 hypothetical protein HMPREF2678_05090 [Corynebacterium sp. HMSC058E07]
MLHAFIDESESGANYFFLGALIVREENLAKLNQALDKIMVEFSSTTSVQPEAELHGYDMMQQKGDWNGIPLRLATAVFTQAMKAIDAYADAFYGEGIDRVKQAERYRVLYHHRTVAIGYVLERIQEHAKRLDERAIAYLDNHYTAPEGRKEFIQYKSKGTFGYRSSKLDRIDEMDFYDSRSYRGLQAADLCTYIYNRTVTCTHAAPKALKTQNLLWEMIATIRNEGRCRIWP